MYKVTVAAVLVLVVVGLLLWSDSAERIDPLSVRQVDETTLLDVVAESEQGSGNAPGLETTMPDPSPADGEGSAILLAQNQPGTQVLIASLTLSEPGMIAIYRDDPALGATQVAVSPVLEPGTYLEYTLAAENAIETGDIIFGVLFTSTATVAAAWDENARSGLLPATERPFAVDADVVGREPDQETAAQLEAVENDLPNRLLAP